MVGLLLAEDLPAAHAALVAALDSGPDGGLPLLRCWLRWSVGGFAGGGDFLDITVTDEVGVPTLYRPDRTTPPGPGDIAADAAALHVIASLGSAARLWDARERRFADDGAGGADPLATLTAAERVTLGWQLALAVAEWIRTDYPNTPSYAAGRPA